MEFITKSDCCDRRIVMARLEPPPRGLAPLTCKPMTRDEVDAALRLAVTTRAPTAILETGTVGGRVTSGIVVAIYPPGRAMVRWPTGSRMVQVEKIIRVDVNEANAERVRLELIAVQRRKRALRITTVSGDTAVGSIGSVSLTNFTIVTREANRILHHAEIATIEEVGRGT
jgi:hypothetical protein